MPARLPPADRDALVVRLSRPTCCWVWLAKAIEDPIRPYSPGYIEGWARARALHASYGRGRGLKAGLIQYCEDFGFGYGADADDEIEEEDESMDLVLARFAEAKKAIKTGKQSATLAARTVAGDLEDPRSREEVAEHRRASIVGFYGSVTPERVERDTPSYRTKVRNAAHVLMLTADRTGQALAFSMRDRRRRLGQAPLAVASLVHRALTRVGIDPHALLSGRADTIVMPSPEVLAQFAKSAWQKRKLFKQILAIKVPKNIGEQPMWIVSAMLGQVGVRLERASYSRVTQPDGTRVRVYALRTLDLSSVATVTEDMQVYLTDTVETGTALADLATTAGQGVPPEFARVQELLAEL